MPEMRKSLRETADEPNPKMWYVDPQLGVMFTSPCEQKMKEAMKLADGTLFNRPAYRTPSSFEEREQRYRDDKAAWEKWNAVMKECVK